MGKQTSNKQGAIWQQPTTPQPKYPGRPANAPGAGQQSSSDKPTK